MALYIVKAGFANLVPDINKFIPTGGVEYPISRLVRNTLRYFKEVLFGALSLMVMEF